MCLVHSQSIIKHAIKMDYTSALETLEGLSNAFAGHCVHYAGALEILYLLVKVIELQKLLIVVNNASCSLYFDS